MVPLYCDSLAERSDNNPLDLRLKHKAPLMYAEDVPICEAYLSREILNVILSDTGINQFPVDN